MGRKPGGRNNARKHGAYAKELFLPNESREQFELLHLGLIEEWSPIGTLEEDTVLTLAQCIWLKRRIEGFYREEALDSSYLNAYEIKLVFYIADELERAETLEQATTWISMLPEKYGKWVEETVPRSSFDDHESWIEAVTLKILRIAGEGERIARTRIDLTGQTPRSAILRELTAKKIALDERLDARIDKAVKRLAQLKAFKQIGAEQASRPKIIDQHNIADQEPQECTN